MLSGIKKQFFSFCFSLILILLQISVHALYAQLPEKSAYPMILNKVGDKFLLSSKPDSALYFYKKAFVLMKDDKYRSAKALLLTHMGNAYHYMDKINESLECSKKSFSLYNELHDTSGMARSGCDIGFYYFELNNRTETFAWLTKSLKFAETSKDALAIGKSYSYLAMLYMEIDDDVNKSQEYLLKAEDIFNKLNEPSWLNNVKNELAVTYQRQGNFDEALKIGRELQIWCAEHNKVYEEAVVLHNMGYVYTRMKDYKSSIEYYQKAIEKFKEIGDSVWISDEYYNIGLDLIADKKYKEAVNMLHAGLGIAQALGEIETESKIAQALVDANEKLGKFEEALLFNRRYILLEDSMNNKEQNKKLVELKTKFETEKKDKEIVLLNKDKQIQSAEVSKQRQLKNLFITGIVLLLLFSLLLFNRYKIKKRSAKLLTEKNIQIQKEKEKAEQSERYKQDFLANMSHEIRTPMNAIIGLTNLLAGKPQDTQSAGYLKAIQHSSQNLLHIINDILDLSKIEAGKMVFDSRTFDLELACELIRSSFSPLAEAKNLKLVIENYVTVKFIKGDEGKLIQVLTNLIGNAIKFTHEGYIKLIVKEESRNGNELVITFNVEDSGIGIAPEDQEYIFETFQQTQSGQNRNYGGTGLGLTISKKIIEGQHGQLTLKSRPGDGSVFSFSLKYEIADGNEPLGLTFVVKNNYLGKAYKGNVKILLAEDNQYNQLVAIDTLKKYFPDAEITLAITGAEVLSRIIDQAFDLVFMDVQMPVLDGFEATKRIRAHESEAFRNLPVIGLTASVIRSDLDKCLDAGMNAYIAKPFHEHELIEAVFNFSRKSFEEMNQEKDLAQEYVAKETKYEDLFLKLVPDRLQIIEKALPKGDWKTIKETIHLMRPQLVASGMTDRETFFESFETMDGSVSFTEWNSKTKLFCILVNKKIEQLQQV